jgi:hypothetical protein
MDISTTKIYLDTSILAKSIMGLREYQFYYIYFGLFSKWYVIWRRGTLKEKHAIDMHVDSEDKT